MGKLLSFEEFLLKYQKEKEKQKAKEEKINKSLKADYARQWRKDNADYGKQYYQDHKEEMSEQQKQYRNEHKEEIKEQKKGYRKSKMGRACYMVSSYKYIDKKYNRGECTLTPQWVVDNIFTSKCRYCQKDDWRKLGCDRIDNSKPHTPDNVVPCCEECNCKRGRKSFEEFLSQCT